MSNHREPNPDKAGWRVGEWADDVGVSRSYVYELISTGAIKSVKIGTARIIVTPPREFLTERAV